jgi:hypothetical protein
MQQQVAWIIELDDSLFYSDPEIHFETLKFSVRKKNGKNLMNYCGIFAFKTNLDDKFKN